MPLKKQTKSKKNTYNRQTTNLTDKDVKSFEGKDLKIERSIIRLQNKSRKYAQIKTKPKPKLTNDEYTKLIKLRKDYQWHIRKKLDVALTKVENKTIIYGGNIEKAIPLASPPHDKDSALRFRGHHAQTNVFKDSSTNTAVIKFFRKPKTSKWDSKPAEQYVQKISNEIQKEGYKVEGYDYFYNVLRVYICRESPYWISANAKKNYIPEILPSGYKNYQSQEAFVWEAKKTYQANGKEIHPAVIVAKAGKGWYFGYYGKRMIKIRNFNTLSQALGWTTTWLRENTL